jgi:DNA-binding sugar fermentation-stimulating protein
LYENVDNRLCVKHLYGNWTKKYPGIEVKGAFWRADRATTFPEFTRAMEHLQKLNEDA